ncbi:MAG TPA: right-handed parallel beta-helix repeat-containing protein, partial [Tepidisphaeraceae bacterium]|nr:right-handed parallel beta-helix repeat-containing protein [Tepidisphaeraceae bacterium]
YCSGPAVITRNTISNNSGIATTMIWDPESDYTWIGSDGGGIYCTDSSATIASNTITGNSASGNGAGLYCNGSWMTVTGNVIANNMANSDAAGGGVWCSGSGMTLARNTVTGNTAYFGAGIYCSGSTGTVADNTVMGNTGYDGGGIYCTGSLAITGNTITGNSGTRGGGIHCGYFSHTTVAGNTISGNSVTCANFRQGGGGIYCYDSSSPIIRNNTIMNNTATGAGSLGYGGGIYCDYQSQPIITNNTIAAGNSAPSGGAVFCYYAPASISNTVIAFNSSGIARYNTSGAVLLKYNCIYSNTAYNFSNLADPTGTNGNISLDPRLANVPARDMHIQPGSPCINTGDLAFVPAAGETDMDGQPRKIGPRVDIGADEFCWAGDADFDGSVSITDLQLLVAAWTTERGDSGYSPATDCNNDGATNVGDLQLLIANWEKTLY